MSPVLFSVGKLSIPSVGFFLALGFLFGVFLIWRLARAWDLDEEKILDLTLLTSLGGLVGARVFFALQNPSLFTSFWQIFLINKMPGLSFWGGFLGGWLTLYIFARRFHSNFWQLADIASVGLLGGLILSSIGCFLGGCNCGTVSKAFFAVTQEGLIGKRWPVQIIEAVILSWCLSKLWFQATHFHQSGKIASLGIIFISIVGLILVPLKQDRSGLIFLIVLLILGITIYYRIAKQNPIIHLKQIKNFCLGLITSPQARKMTIQTLSKTWYNQTTLISWKIRDFKKGLRRPNVKLSKRNS